MSVMRYQDQATKINVLFGNIYRRHRPRTIVGFAQERWWPAVSDGTTLGVPREQDPHSREALALRSQLREKESELADLQEQYDRLTRLDALGLPAQAHHAARALNQEVLGLRNPPRTREMGINAGPRRLMRGRRVRDGSGEPCGLRHSQGHIRDGYPPDGRPSVVKSDEAIDQTQDTQISRGQRNDGAEKSSCLATR